MANINPSIFKQIKFVCDFHAWCVDKLEALRPEHNADCRTIQSPVTICCFPSGPRMLKHGKQYFSQAHYTLWLRDALQHQPYVNVNVSKKPQKLSSPDNDLYLRDRFICPCLAWRLGLSLYHWGRPAPPLARSALMLQNMVEILYIIEREGQRFRRCQRQRGEAWLSRRRRTEPRRSRRQRSELQ